MHITYHEWGGLDTNLYYEFTSSLIYAYRDTNDSLKVYLSHFLSWIAPGDDRMDICHKSGRDEVQSHFWPYLTVSILKL